MNTKEIISNLEEASRMLREFDTKHKLNETDPQDNKGNSIQTIRDDYPDIDIIPEVWFIIKQAIIDLKD